MAHSGYGTRRVSDIIIHCVVIQFHTLVINDKCFLYVADSFSELQMYVVFEFEDSGADLEAVEVS